MYCPIFSDVYIHAMQLALVWIYFSFFAMKQHTNEHRFFLKYVYNICRYLYYIVLLLIYIRCRKNFYTCLQIFNHNPESNEDINLAHIVPKIKPPEPLNDPHAAIVFQPTAWASPAHTKTNRWRVDRLGALEVWFLAQCVPNGCLHWILGYG